MSAPASAALTVKQHAHLAEARAALTAIIVDTTFKKVNEADRNSIVGAHLALSEIIDRAVARTKLREDTTP